MSVGLSSKRLLSMLRVEKRRSTVEYAQDEIVFNQEASPFPGRIDFDRTPQLREILNDRDNPHVWLQSIFASTQTSKTLALFIAAAKVLNDGDGMAILAIPNEKDVVDYEEQKVAPFIESIKSLKKKLFVKKDEDNSRFRKSKKQTAGATLNILGNTPPNRSSKTVKHLFIDEARLFGKGHITEFIGRTKAFSTRFRKVMIVSSWEKEGDEAQLSYEMCDCKKELQTYCNSCGSHFYATSKDFKFITKEEYLKEFGIEEKEYSVHAHSKEARKDVYIQCECGHKIHDEERLANIRNGETRLVITDGDESDVSIGYKLNALASTLTLLPAMADILIKSADYPEDMSRFYRDYFNEIWQGAGDDIETDDILLLGNGLPRGVVPKDTWKIIMGVDTQKDHVYYEVKAYCYGNISHTILHGKIMGYEIGEDFTGIKEIVQSPLFDEDGTEYYIDHIGEDKRGYNEDGYTRTQDVNDFLIELQEWAEDNGIEDLVYATQGVDDIRDDKYMVIKKDNLNLTKNDNPLKVLTYSNLKIKNRLSSTISRTINMVKSQDDEEPIEYKNKLFFINQGIVEDAEERKANFKGEKYKAPQSSYESHLSSEVYDKIKGGWGNPKQRRNDWLDTSCICESIAVLKGVDRAVAEEDSRGVDLLAMQRRFQT